MKIHDDRVRRFIELYQTRHEIKAVYQLRDMPKNMTPNSVYGYVRDDFLDAIYLCKQDNEDMTRTECALSYDYGLGVYVAHIPAYNNLVNIFAQELRIGELAEWVALSQEILNISDIACGVISVAGSDEIKGLLEKVSEAARSDSQCQ